MATYWTSRSRVAETRKRLRNSFWKLLAFRYVPPLLITDKLKSYDAVEQEGMPNVEIASQE
jgi:hypothetical protein